MWDEVHCVSCENQNPDVRDAGITLETNVYFCSNDKHY